ncbi:MAG TPA: hypothetical protein VKX46_05925, partial [Ktedonobacteraceae bacterium]|nr:hypothetical protein [Ktedonobacteraceae bacterium]
MMQQPSPQEPAYRLGLASPEAINQFVEAVRKIQADWSTLGTAEKRAAEFFKALATLLKNLAIPEPTFQLASLDVYGEFSYQDWKLAVDSRALSPSTISAESIKELADTFYHETRHCEQFFNVARFLANGEKNTAEMIAKTMPIPEAVAKQAKSSPLEKGTTAEENKR